MIEISNSEESFFIENERLKKYKTEQRYSFVIYLRP